MEYRLMGTTGLRVSALGMGTMTFGREADRSESAAIFGRCRDVGINLFDCANSYSGGEATSCSLALIFAHDGYGPARMDTSCRIGMPAHGEYVLAYHSSGGWIVKGWLVIS